YRCRAPARRDRREQEEASRVSTRRRRVEIVGRHEVDLRLLEVDAHDLDPNAVREPPRRTGPLAHERMADGVEVKIVGPELGDVDEAVDVEPVQRDENAEMRHTADRPGERLADPILHEVALEPVLDVARGLVGTPLGERAVHAQLGPGGAAWAVVLARET